MYSNPQCPDVLKMRERIEQHINAELLTRGCNSSPNSQLKGENSSHSTTEPNVVPDQIIDEEEEIEADATIMDRADVLFKYILRSFRKYYCK
jgi:hypothetical protein